MDVVAAAGEYDEGFVARLAERFGFRLSPNEGLRSAGARMRHWIANMRPAGGGS